MSTEENKAFLRTWVEEVWNKGNVALVDQMVAANYLYHDPQNPLHGPDGFKGLHAMYRSAFPDLQFTIEDMVAEGDKVAWRYTGSGTHQGELMGIPPTGKRAVVTGILISRIVNGQFVEDWNTIDLLGMLQQLGVIPAMA